MSGSINNQHNLAKIARNFDGNPDVTTGTHQDH